MGWEALKILSPGGGEPSEQVLEVEEGVVALQLRRLDKGERDGHGLTASHTPHNEPVPAAQRDGTQRPLDRVVIQRQATVLKASE
jgi:hypothetical protein